MTRHSGGKGGGGEGCGTEGARWRPRGGGDGGGDGGGVVVTAEVRLEVARGWRRWEMAPGGVDGGSGERR